MPTLEFGLDTFLPLTVDEAGLPISGDRVIRNTSWRPSVATNSRRSAARSERRTASRWAQPATTASHSRR